MLDLPDYPGRLIVAGTLADGVRFGAYLLTARSPASRNRLLVYEDAVVKTVVADRSQLIDPSLLVYTAMQRSPASLIIANGDHGDLIKDALLKAAGPAQALALSTYEPDEPHYTARISLVATDKGYTISILRKAAGECERSHWTYRWPQAGRAHLIHTYAGDGAVLPSYCGEPRLCAVGCGAETALTWLYESADERYRLAAALWLLEKQERVALINSTDGVPRWIHVN